MRVSQAERLRRLLADGQPHSTFEILERVYGGSHFGVARIAARVHDLRKAGHDVTSWKDENEPTLWWYQMGLKPKAIPQYVMIDGVMHVRIVRAENHAQ